MGKEELLLDLDPSLTYSIKEIVSEITKWEGNRLSTMLIEMQKKSRETVRFVVNGKDISSLNGLETKVHDGDHITIFPLLAGG